jgi:hypothetical protein
VWRSWRIPSRWQSCSAVQCSAVQCSAVQCSAVQCSSVAVQCSAVQCSPCRMHCASLQPPPLAPQRCSPHAAACLQMLAKLAPPGVARDGMKKAGKEVADAVAEQVVAAARAKQTAAAARAKKADSGKVKDSLVRGAAQVQEASQPVARRVRLLLG